MYSQCIERRETGQQGGLDVERASPRIDHLVLSGGNMVILGYLLRKHDILGEGTWAWTFSASSHRPSGLMQPWSTAGPSSRVRRLPSGTALANKATSTGSPSLTGGTPRKSLSVRLEFFYSSSRLDSPHSPLVRQVKISIVVYSLLQLYNEASS